MARGCYNRPPFKPFMMIQDGWITTDNFTRLPRMIASPFRMSKNCQYQKDDQYADPLCVGCKHKEAK